MKHRASRGRRLSLSRPWACWPSAVTSISQLQEAVQEQGVFGRHAVHHTRVKTGNELGEEKLMGHKSYTALTARAQLCVGCDVGKAEIMAKGWCGTRSRCVGDMSAFFYRLREEPRIQMVEPTFDTGARSQSNQSPRPFPGCRWILLPLSRIEQVGGIGLS